MTRQDLFHQEFRLYRRLERQQRVVLSRGLDQKFRRPCETVLVADLGLTTLVGIVIHLEHQKDDDNHQHDENKRHQTFRHDFLFFIEGVDFFAGCLRFLTAPCAAT